MHAHYPLADTDLGSRTKAVGTTSGEGEACDKVCEIADAPVSLKSDMWKCFGFCMTRNENEKRLQMTDLVQYVDNARLLLIHTSLSACIVLLQVQSLFNKH